jgi:hypothetical protein
MAPLTAKIQQITEFTRYGPGTNTTPYVRVGFTVGVHGPFYVEVEKDVFTADLARQLMQPTVDFVNALENPAPAS